MGGKSKSSTETKTSTTTTQNIQNDTRQADASGVVGGNLLQGEITYNEQFPEGVATAFQSVIELANNAMTGAKGVADTALDKVAVRSAQAENPQLSTIQELVPVAMLGVVVIGFLIWRRK